MLSGLHRVSSIYCGVCDNDRAIGWKYVRFLSYSRSRHTNLIKNSKRGDIFSKGITSGRKIGMKEMMLKANELLTLQMRMLKLIRIWEFLYSLQKYKQQ